MTQTSKPVSEIQLIGNVGYQIWSNTFRGRVQYYAKVGKPLIDRETGEASILPWMMDNATRDFIAASEESARQLEELRNAAFRQDVQASATSVSPTNPVAEEPLQTDLPSTPLKLASNS